MERGFLMRTQETHVLAQTWQLYCLDCLQLHQEHFETWHGKGDTIAWRHHGMPSQPPWIDPSCPGCRGLRVKVLPTRSFIPRQS